jgi:hypothetical protein
MGYMIITFVKIPAFRVSDSKTALEQIIGT